MIAILEQSQLITNLNRDTNDLYLTLKCCGRSGTSFYFARQFSLDRFLLHFFVLKIYFSTACLDDEMYTTCHGRYPTEKMHKNIPSTTSQKKFPTYYYYCN